MKKADFISPHAEQDKYPDSGEYFKAMREKETKKAEKVEKKVRKVRKSKK